MSVLLSSDAAAPAAALVSQMVPDLCSCSAASPSTAIATPSAALPTPIEYLRVANLIQTATIANIHNILMMPSAVICKPVMRLSRMSDSLRHRDDAGYA